MVSFIISILVVHTASSSSSSRGLVFGVWCRVESGSTYDDDKVQSTDKNFMVPVGGAIVAGPAATLVDKAGGHNGPKWQTSKTSSMWFNVLILLGVF